MQKNRKRSDERLNEVTRRYRDLLEIAYLVSSIADWDYLIKTALDHLSRRLSARVRCILMEDGKLTLKCWVGTYECSMEQVPIVRESIVWDVVTKGQPVNLTDPAEMNGYLHTLKEMIKIKAIVPLRYINPITREEKKVGALVADSGKKGVPISDEDFEYLKAVGELIGAAVGKAKLVEELVESYRKREAVVRETTHTVRNSIAIIGGFSRRIARLATDAGLAVEADILTREVKELETHVREFEKYLEVE